MGCLRQDVRAAFGYNARGELKKVVWIDETFGMTERLARSECAMAGLRPAMLDEQDARALLKKYPEWSWRKKRTQRGARHIASSGGELSPTSNNFIRSKPWLT
jgi:hypothetical protein